MAADAAGSPWIITLDETRPGPAGMALGQVNAAVARDIADPEHDDGRKGALWANIMAGGAGMNTYVGFGTDVGEKSTSGSGVDVPDLMLQDFRTYDKWWDQMRAAHAFFTSNKVPFQDMSNHSELIRRGGRSRASGRLWAIFRTDPSEEHAARPTARRMRRPFPGPDAGAAGAPPGRAADRPGRDRRRAPGVAPGLSARVRAVTGTVRRLRPGPARPPTPRP